MVRKSIIKLLLLTLVSCAVGNQQVFFNEMSTTPILKLNENQLIIKTSNSIKNSALSIYKINITVNQKKKEVYLSANQAVRKEYKEPFIIKLNDHNIKEPKIYIYYWIDPDKKTTKLNDL